MGKRFILILLIFLITLSLCSCNYQKITEEKNETTNTIYAVWLNYNELSMMNEADKSEHAFRKKAEEIVRNCADNGINRIFVQVRPFSDAFYKSEIFPSTVYLSGRQGEYVGYDALAIMCEITKRYNIAIDAWINPYRVSYDKDYSNLSADNPARIWIEQRRTDIVKVTDNGILYNPSSFEAQKLVLDGVRELIENYHVSGIHIDDYFYPTTDEGFDSSEYTDYINKGGNLTLGDWRRENVNSLIEQIYITVHSYNDKLVFSVSPSGDIEKNYENYYADVGLWMSEKGYCDMIIPQLYYGFENENKPFVQTLDNWLSIKRDENVKLLTGLSFYKYGSEDRYAGSGKDEWMNSKDIISRQIRHILTIDRIDGFSLYSYSYLFSKNNDEICKKELQNIKNMIE
jgi:uncharacterized lipoprotein YddW (UPF0748 family)